MSGKQAIYMVLGSAMQNKTDSLRVTAGFQEGKAAFLRIRLMALLVLGTLGSFSTTAQTLVGKLQDFNIRLAAATRAMDSAATLKLWDEDGTSILPEMSALKGKPAIRAAFDKVIVANPGGHMRSFELVCHPLAIGKSLASEWCDEHQIIDFASGRPSFEGRGKLLLVLRYGHGSWRILAEMWVPAPTPAAAIKQSK